MSRYFNGSEKVHSQRKISFNPICRRICMVMVQWAERTTKESRVVPFYRAVFRRLTHETARTSHAEGRPPGFDPFRHMMGTHAMTNVRYGVASARRSARLAVGSPT